MLGTGIKMDSFLQTFSSPMSNALFKTSSRSPESLKFIIAPRWSHKQNPQGVIGRERVTGDIVAAIITYWDGPAFRDTLPDTWDL